MRVMNKLNKSVLIIGGCGYIGSALYRHLDDLGEKLDLAPGEGRVLFSKYAVDTVDLEWFGNYVNPRNFILDYRNLTAEFLAKYDAVVLLAGYSSPAICNNSGTPSVFQNNVANFTHLLPKLKEHQKFIYASSITVYQGQQGEMEEDSHIYLAPSNSYDFSKQDCDRMMAMYPWVQFYGLRLATVCGASENFRNDIMVNAMTDSAVVTSEIKLFNPKNSKPILYMGDLVRAIETIIDSPLDNRGFYNLASYNGITSDIAEAVASVTNSNLKLISASEMQNSALPATAYDISVSTRKFEDTFGFKFYGTTESITAEIVSHMESLHKSKRVTGIRYV
jgi:nucleoside-diphosphate-sugar epimerase